MNSVSKVFLFARVFLFAASVPILMRLKLATVASVLEPNRGPNAVDPNLVTRILAYVETVIRRGNPLVRPGCLTRGLTRYYFLRRAGLDVSLHFGIGRNGKQGEFVGHCWLVREGEPYFEREDPRPLYAEMHQISRKNSRKTTGTEPVRFERLTHS